MAKKTARRSSSSPRRTTPSKVRSGTRSAGTFCAKIRMYRQGLGDCFLVTLPLKIPRGGRNVYYIMIDLGVILGTPDAADIMTKVVDDLVQETGGRIDLLLATHAHWDHISGFTQAAKALKRLKFDEVWMPWTEDPDDPKGRGLQLDREGSLAALQMGLAQMRLAAEDTDETAELAGLLDFFGMGSATAEALEAVRKLNPGNVRYCRPTDKPIDHDPTGVRFYVLGPPLEEAFLKKTNPSKAHPETYGTAFDTLVASAPAAVTDKQPMDSPFSTLFAIPIPAARAMEFFGKYYWTADGSDQWRKIETAAFAHIIELALQLDKVTNNTSLVLAIELADGQVLLFPGDAQIGSWLSWGQRQWKVDARQVTGADLLKRTIFYKVGHHGSHNATLSTNGLESMESLEVAMIPVDQEMAKKKRWGHIPLDKLIAELKSRAKTVIRSDKPAPANTAVVSGLGGLFYEIVL